MDDSWGVVRPHPRLKGALFWPPELVGMRAHTEQRSSETQPPSCCVRPSAVPPRASPPPAPRRPPAFLSPGAWAFHVNGVIQCAACYAWFLSLGVMLSRSVGIQHARALRFLRWSNNIPASYSLDEFPSPRFCGIGSSEFCPAEGAVESQRLIAAKGPGSLWGGACANLVLGSRTPRAAAEGT